MSDVVTFGRDDALSNSGSSGVVDLWQGANGRGVLKYGEGIESSRRGLGSLEVTLIELAHAVGRDELHEPLKSVDAGFGGGMRIVSLGVWAFLGRFLETVSVILEENEELEPCDARCSPVRDVPFVMGEEVPYFPE